jgi:hypothetical protein
MARGFLDYLPQSVLDATSTNDFTSTVQTAMGAQLMQPVGQQLASLMPEPEPMPQPAPMPQPEPPMPKPFSLGSLEDWGFGSAAASRQDAPKPQNDAVTPQRGMFSLPDVSAWMPALGGAQEPTAQPSAAPTGATPGGPTEFNAYVRQASAQRGLDPDQVLKVVGKEGPTGWGSVGRFDTGESYGPLQLHYGGGSNPKQGMGDDFTKATGIDLRKVDANTPEGIAAHQRAVDFALDRLSKTGDYREWYGADPALGSRMTKVNRVTPVEPPTGQLPTGQQSQPAGAPAYGTYTAENLVDNQITAGAEQGLTPAEAMAVCGPAAAVAFARANGRNPTLREAKELGSQLGVWNAGQGMAGPASQVKLLEHMGVPARLVGGADEAAIAREIQSGKPVTIDTPGHYYVATGYDPQTRTFEFGNSAGVLKSSKGRTRYRLDELAGLGMGAPRATIFMGAAR